MTDTLEESNLVKHARYELQLLGEDQDVIDWYLKVIQAFADYGHSGGSASVAIPTLNDLLMCRNLTPLTNDPKEWMDITGYSVDDSPLWQSKRRSEAFSHDGGNTYYLVSDGFKMNGKPKKIYTSKKVNHGEDHTSSS